MQIAELEYRLDSSVFTQRVLHLRVGAGDVQLAVDRVAGKLRGKVAVAGFRKGNAPLAVVRKEHWQRIEAEAFDELNRASVAQVHARLEEKDRPFTPPEVVDRGKVRLRYGRPLEFAVKYLVDPGGIARNPERPDQSVARLPGEMAGSGGAGLPMGVPTGPRLPSIPAAPNAAESQRPPGLPETPSQ